MVSTGGPTGAGARRSRLGRSIAQSQLLISVAMLLLAGITLVVRPDAFAQPVFSVGILLVFVLTAVAVLVPWTESNKGWAIALPLADIVAIVLAREGLPALGSGLFLVFPVLWMARNFRLTGALLGAALATVLLWTSWALKGEPFVISQLATIILLPLTLAFVSTTGYETSRRATGQRTLLRQQATVIEGAFARARRQERLLHEVLDAVEFGVIAFDEGGTVTLVNNAHRRLLDRAGAPASAIVHPVVYQADRVTPHPEGTRPFARALAGQTFENLVIWVGEPDGDQEALSITARALTAPDGSRDGGVIVLRNVTAELEAIRARDELVGSVSHELNTPLTSIIGYLELALDDEELADDSRRMIDIAHRNAERMRGLVSDLLRAGSGEDRSLAMDVESCDLVTIVRGSIDAQRLTADARGITIEASLPESAETTADPLRMRQVIDNLLTNAIKYNRPDGSITVRARAAPEGGTISVVVADTGYGISKSEQSRLFDRFYRTESARQSSATGTGLGLSITREIIRQHGGDLLVRSTPGVGSEFEMIVPVVRPQ